MVFQKKGATPAKSFQPKKKGKKQVEADDDDSDMFNDMDDSDDFEDDSEDEMPVQKTPRQSMGEKKVTFDMTKNTPGKTPNKNNLKKTPAKSKESLQVVTPGKTPNKNALNKTPTPAKGKGALQEFKGIKSGKPQQKKGDAEDDDDDDEEEDDDDDVDEEDDDDLDLEMGEGMDEDDDDDEDDEDEDDDDDDDDEEEEDEKPKQKQKNNVAQNNQTKNVKNEVASPQKDKNTPRKNTETQNLEIQRRRERDVKSLYIGGLPLDVTSEELQALSPDINNIILPKSNRKNQKFAFGFLVFASEAKAEANYKTLQGKKFRGQLLTIDFVGEKSKRKPVQHDSLLKSKINERKLYVTGLPINATLAQVAAFFPKAYQITFNKSPTFRTASINYDKIEDANEAFATSKNVEMNGKKLIVVHSTVSSMKKKHKKSRPQKKRNSTAKQGGTPAKKMKFKQEESDEE